MHTPHPLRTVAARWGSVAAVLLAILQPASSSATTLGQIGGEVLAISADHLDVDLSKGDAVLEGQVRVTFGALNVSCDRVDIRYDDAPVVRWARGTGNVHATMRGIAATAQTLDVNVPARQVRLVGGVRIERGQGWVQADRASIDLISAKITLDQVRGSIPVEAKRP